MMVTNLPNKVIRKNSQINQAIEVNQNLIGKNNMIFFDNIDSDGNYLETLNESRDFTRERTISYVIWRKEKLFL